MKDIFGHPWMRQMERHYNIKLEQYIYRESSNSMKNIKAIIPEE